MVCAPGVGAGLGVVAAGAAGAAKRSNSGGREVVSMQNQISYLSSPKGNTLYAAANCIKSGRSTCLYEVVVTDDTGRMVAFTTVSGFVVGERK